jgi:hypothetical protein
MLALNAIQIFYNLIRNSDLSEPLKTQVLSKFDTIQITKAHRTFSVIRITIPAQKEMSYLGDDAFIRDGSSTKQAKGKEIASIYELFKR